MTAKTHAIKTNLLNLGAKHPAAFCKVMAENAHCSPRANADAVIVERWFLFLLTELRNAI